MKHLAPFFTYFGGKYRTAPRYPESRYARIVEPFAGSAGYALRHHRRRVTLYDIDPTVAATWDYLIRVPADEIRRLPLWDGTWNHVDELAVPQEARWLIGWWLNKGSAGPRNMPTTWMRDGTHIESFWGAAIRERIASQVDAIRHWEIRCASYTEAPDVEATWFVDPPYQAAGRHYRHGAGQIDYTHLAEWCRTRPGQVIVCENAGADWLPFRPWLAAKATPKPGSGNRSVEVVWLGVDEIAEQGVFDLGAA